MTTISAKKNSPSLSNRVIKGGFWTFSLRGVQQIFGFARLIILARILSPTDFGLIGVALLTIATVDTFTQTGLQDALIQKTGDIKSYLNAAWTVSIIRGFILFIILYFVASYAAIFFDTPEAELVIRVISFSIIIKSFYNIGTIYFQKELEFSKVFAYRLVGSLVDFTISIIAVLIFKNIWALVFGMLAGNMTTLFISYLIHPYRPTLSSNVKKIKELFGFGKWILGSSILTFALVQGDDVFVGKTLGPSALGFYQLAYKISNMPATELSHIVAKVTYPAYSTIQDDRQKLRKAYLKVLQFTTFLSIPMAGFIFVLAPDFTMIFLGEKWLPMIPAMQILAIYGMLRGLGATTGVLFMAVGQPEISTKIKLAQLLLLSIIIYPLTMHWGIVGTSIAVTSYAFIFNFFAVTKVLSIINSNYKKPSEFLIIPLAFTSLIVLVILIFKKYVFINVNLITFLFLAASGVTIYLAGILLFDIFFNDGITTKTIKNHFSLFNNKQQRR